jgi:hypothetical protein
MTPEQQAYKDAWRQRGGIKLSIPRTKDTEAKTWCRRHVPRHQWSMDTFTTPDTHTVVFETQEHATYFKTDSGIECLD